MSALQNYFQHFKSLHSISTSIKQNVTVSCCLYMSVIFCVGWYCKWNNTRLYFASLSSHQICHSPSPSKKYLWRLYHCVHLVVEVHVNSSRVISQSVWKLTEPLTGMGDNDRKLPDDVVGDDNRDLEVLAWRLGMMVKMYNKTE